MFKKLVCCMLLCVSLTATAAGENVMVRCEAMAGAAVVVTEMRDAGVPVQKAMQQAQAMRGSLSNEAFNFLTGLITSIYMYPNTNADRVHTLAFSSCFDRFK
jgi:hypothetical protein